MTVFSIHGIHNSVMNRNKSSIPAFNNDDTKKTKQKKFCFFKVVFHSNLENAGFILSSGTTYLSPCRMTYPPTIVRRAEK